MGDKIEVEVSPEKRLYDAIVEIAKSHQRELDYTGKVTIPIKNDDVIMIDVLEIAN